jgi:nitrogen-specific signal transduction histidine kinase
VKDDTTSYDGDFASSTNVAVLVVGKDGVIRHHTSEAARMLASADEDLVGRPLPSLLRPEASGELEGLLRRVMGQSAARPAFVEATCSLANRGRQLIRVTAVNMAEDPELAMTVLCQFGDPAGIRQPMSLLDRQRGTTRSPDC